MVDSLNSSYTILNICIVLFARCDVQPSALFTFLEETGVPFNNNLAERMIRPAVIMRKNSFCSRSESVAQTQEILMSVFKTLALKSIEPVNYVVEYLENSIQNNHYQRTEKLAA